MRRLLTTLVLAVALVTVLAAPGAAITGGQPDGTGHPYVGLLLAPGLTFCSGTLIDEDTILTAGHCTSFWSQLEEEGELEGPIMVSFDPVAQVDDDWMPAGGTWYEASEWITFPGYSDDDWPFTPDYGLLYLDEPVDIEPADLPDPNVLTPLIESKGQTDQLFDDVGYGIQGLNVGDGRPTRAITWERKIAVQRYHPGNGATSALLHETWFILHNSPSPRHGGACGGDSGSPILFHGTDTIVAVHTGGYRLTPFGFICGRLTSLNHRIDLVSEDFDVLGWIQDNM